MWIKRCVFVLTPHLADAIVFVIIQPYQEKSNINLDIAMAMAIA